MPRMHSQLISFARSNNEKVITYQECQSAMVVNGQTITAKVSHQNWCKSSQQKPWSYVVRQSPQKFHTRTGAKFHRKSHGRMWSDNHRKSFSPELVQSFTAKAMVVRLETIVVVVSLGRLSFRANACNKSRNRKKYVKACPLADKFRISLQLTKRKPKFVSCQFLFVSLHPN